jgi:hypothetical protein
MVRLLDARGGSYAEVRPARPGLLRVCAHVPATAGGTDITWLRVPLVADLLFRAAELRGVQVITVLAFAGQSAAQMETFGRAAGAVGIHPPAAHASLPEAHTSPGGPIDVHVVSQGTDGDGGQGGLVTRVGAAQIWRADGHDAAAAGNVLAGPADPLAVRLALMSFPYHQPADLTEELLASADETVARWRRQVAQWAQSPSRPMPARISQAAGAAFGDLDTVSALGLLRDLSDDADVPAGAKFETFVYADRILGLDLPRDIGRTGS